MLKLAFSAHSRLLFSTKVNATESRTIPAPASAIHDTEIASRSVQNLTASAKLPPEGIIGVTEIKEALELAAVMSPT